MAQNECFVAEDSVEVIVNPLSKKPDILNGVPSVKPNERFLTTRKRIRIIVHIPFDLSGFSTFLFGVR
ncbi:MAG: hypothetical protein LBH34_01980 [Prevotellaceae bacterium]|nr:hypothetical protein [Prevotellaceae bacterium]